MKFSRISKRKLSKVNKRLKLLFPNIMKSYNSDLSQKYFGNDLKNFPNKTYPQKIMMYNNFLTPSTYKKIISDLPKVKITKKPKVFKYYKKYKIQLRNNNIKKANEMIQNLFNSECFFTYEFSIHIINEFLGKINDIDSNFDKNYAIKIMNQLTYKEELNVLNEITDIYYEDITLLNNYFKQLIMEIRLSENGKEKLCVNIEDFQYKL